MVNILPSHEDSIALAVTDTTVYMTLKDCRVCNRRRIKCDRSTPSCKKCTSKNLRCPGYRPILNWDWGVASRGKLAGKKVPFLSPAIVSSRRVQEKDTGPGSAHDDVADEYNSMDAMNVPRASRAPGSLQAVNAQKEELQSRRTSISWTEDEVALRDALSSLAGQNLRINQNLFPSSVILQNSMQRRLFHHYGQILAASMAWIDSPENQWRTIIMPMAVQSPTLRTSVLAFAAEHLSAVLPEDQIFRHALSRCSNEYRDRALRLLALEMRSQTISSGPTTIPGTKVSYQNDLANSILASMLVLCNMETVRPDSRLWRVHLDAARTIVNLRRSMILPNEEISTFLVHQFFIADAFACTTSFEPIDYQNVLAEDAGCAFIEFLKLVRWVTWLERQAAAQAVSATGVTISPSALRSLFEQARDRTLVISANNSFATPAEQEQFNCIVESFHHAGLLYSYRCLSYPDVEEEISKSRLALFQNLDLVQSDHPSFAQDVMWPLFIAGTEAQSEDRKMALVERKLQQAMKRTGFSNCESVLAFLRAFWLARDEFQGSFCFSKDGHNHQGTGREFNWIRYARDWTSSGNHFFVY